MKSLLRPSCCLTLAVLGCTAPPNGIDRYLQDIEFSGAALVVQDERMVLRRGYGFAERELGVSNTPEGVFRIGSLAKPLTSTALLHAVDRGYLQLDDSICNYVRFCPPDWLSVQVHHLLSHTSGVPDLFGALPSAPLLETTAVIDTLLGSRTTIALRSTPGAAFAYSNFNYMLVGYVLEAATNVDWESYLRDSVLVPIGAVDTRYDDAWSLIERRVRGYRRGAGGIQPIEYKDHSAYAAGGLLSTVDDLHTWHGALVRGEIISDSLVARATTPVLDDYGLGWQIIEALGRPMHNHTGGISGFASHLAWYPAQHLLIVLLSNVEEANVKAIACDLARIVFKETDLPSPSADWLDRPTTVRCARQSLP